MSFENLNQLVTAAETEVGDVATAEEALVVARDELTQAQDVVASKQASVDAARESVATERAEAIAALRAIVDAVQAKITELEPTT